jgi:hypothetical protein
MELLFTENAANSSLSIKPDASIPRSGGPPTVSGWSSGNRICEKITIKQGDAIVI